jgi:hypothetical protein
MISAISLLLRPLSRARSIWSEAVPDGTGATSAATVIKAAVALGQFAPLPYVAEKDLFREIDELGGYSANFFARRG